MCRTRLALIPTQRQPTSSRYRPTFNVVCHFDPPLLISVFHFPSSSSASIVDCTVCEVFDVHSLFAIVFSCAIATSVSFPSIRTSPLNVKSKQTSSCFPHSFHAPRLRFFWEAIWWLRLNWTLIVPVCGPGRLFSGVVLTVESSINQECSLHDSIRYDDILPWK
jgi:hypothetical protein